MGRKITCVGAGPAGLYFAILAKLLDSDHAVTVIERGPEGITYGWGVVFWDGLLEDLERTDPETARRVRDNAFRWSDLVVRVDAGPPVRDPGHGYSMRRQTLLSILIERARELEVELVFGREIEDASELAGSDLVVASDGVNSRLRQQSGETFGTRAVRGRNKYIWLGTSKVFDSFTFPFVHTQVGLIWAHAYGFDSEGSTFIVETSPETWRGLGFEGLPPGQSMKLLEGLFEASLEGHPLQPQVGTRDHSPWLEFQTVTNRSWHHGNLALMGDAAHTTHFTIGSGTRLALEDAIGLATQLHVHGDIPAALAAYGKQRSGDLVEAQRTARNSAHWYENVPRYSGHGTSALAELMSRRRSSFLRRMPPRLYLSLVHGGSRAPGLTGLARRGVYGWRNLSRRWLPQPLSNHGNVESPRPSASDERTESMEASSSKTTSRGKSAAGGRTGNGASAGKTQKKSQKRSGSNAGLESFNPATGELIGSVETLTPGKVQGVVDDVAEVQPFWAALTLSDRARYLRRACDVLLEDLDEVAELITNEQGKPRVESYTMELLPTVDSLKWIADNGPEILADEKQSMPLFLKSKSAKFTYEPIGVVGVIAPWNYPWSIPFGEVAIALMAGNGVVLKPASLTPLIGDRIRQTFEKAGLPEGLVRTVHGGGRIGDALVKSTAGKIFFTGSVEVGRKVGVECAKRMKGSVLELGGKDPQIVCPDADLANAISGAVWGGFANAGQTCSGIERVYVHKDVADAFIEGVVRETERLTVGGPREWTTEIGPMVSEEQAEIVNELVDDAVENGATRLTGGPVEVEGMRGSFIAPTVLTGVTHEMRIMNEEIFGPVLPVMRVDSEQEAIDLANDSKFGLGASIWTKDRAKGERMAHEIQSGMVWINDHSFSHGACVCAWGGVKDSGLGRSHSKFGFYECVNIKQLAWEPGWARDIWWQPYDRKLGDAIRYSAQLLYSRNGNRLHALREGIRPLVEVTRRTMRKGS